MTPKEKAKELVDSFIGLNSSKISDYSRIEYPTAKECALIAVCEVLKSIDWDYYEGSSQTEHNWWKEVKQEIEKL